ncbi:MAG TPA: PTS system mannose/fructose/sorbose family transporter subunit IID [Ktedonobacteraceae bacterium]|nr:PTS system mannose/fructose/sorbose family transporter subunit IID [Ktedonobacteraceae bacterium]
MSDDLEKVPSTETGSEETELTDQSGSSDVATLEDSGDTITSDDSKDVVTLDRSVIRKAMWRHLITLQWSWNYERMQGLGYTYSMLPVINAVYHSKEERIAAIKRHLVFYNTNPQVGSPAIFGATVALEAQKEGEAVDSIKVGLMGPLAGIGDTVQGILYRPIVAVIAASLALAGSLFGPLIMVLSGILWTVLMIPQFFFGYRQGIGVAREVSSEGRLARFTELITIMGMVVIGGFIPSIMSAVTTPLKYAQKVSNLGQVHTETVALQSTLDQLLPYLIPVLFVAFAYWLLRGLKLSAVWVLIILFVVAFGLSLIGVL